MRRDMFMIALACALSTGGVSALSTVTVASEVDILATVRITHAVMAGGTPLPAGTYEVRLAGVGPPPLVGQSRDAQPGWSSSPSTSSSPRRPEVLHDDDVTPLGASSMPVRRGTRVEMLKGGEFLRVSVKREGERYLVHLPVMR